MTDVASVLQQLKHLESDDPEYFVSYASSLRIDAHTDIKIIRQLVDQYFAIGHFRKASEILVSTERTEPQTDGFEEFEEVLLAVARARLELRITFDTAPAMALLRQLEQVSTFEQEVDSNVSCDINACEEWILFEGGITALQSDLMKYGLYSQGEAKIRAQHWLKKAYRLLANIDHPRARRMELTLVRSLTGSSPEEKAEQLELLQMLIKQLPDRSRAQTLAMLTYAENSTSALTALQRLGACERRFSCESDLLLVKCLATKVNPDADKYPSYLQLARQFHKIGQLACAWSCVELAISSIYQDVDRWKKFMAIEAIARPLIDEMDDRWIIEQFNVSKWIARAFAPPRNPVDVDEAIRMLKNLAEPPMTPASDYARLSVLRDCVANLRRDDEAAKYGDELITHPYARLDYDRVSLLVNALSTSNHTKIANRLKTPLTMHERMVLREDIQTEIDRLERYFQSDVDHGLFEPAGRKLERLLLYFDTLERRYPDEIQQAKASKAMTLSRFDANPKLIMPESVTLFAARSGRSAVDQADLRLRRLDAISQPLARSEAHLLCAVSRRSCLQQNRSLLDTAAFQVELDIIMNHLWQSLALLQQADSSNMLFMRATAPMLDTVYDLLQIGVDRLTELREFLFTIERALTSYREAYSNRPELSSLMESRILETDHMRRDFYNRTADFFYRTNMLEDWRIWHERGRSRALLSRFIQPSITDATASTTLSDSIPEDGQGVRLMFASIFQIIDSIQPGIKVTMIDFHVSLLGDISLVAINSETREHQTVNTGLTTDTVQSWYLSNLDDAAARLSNHPAALRDLQPLAVAIEGVTTKDDLLILLPTFPLDRFPLHAIATERQCLASRNPILYTSSLSLLHHCLGRSCQAENNFYHPVFMSAYDELTEEELISQTQTELCKQLKCDMPLSQVNVARFTDKLQTSQWTHYHGHADFVLGRPLEQTFELSDGKVTVAELLSLKLPNSVMVSIACDSNVQDNNQANEPLGLSAALLIAGSASVLGTLWKTRSHAGREYTKLLYAEILKQVHSKPEGWLNLTELNRKAMGRLMWMGGFRAPCDWAPFVLQGSPFFRYTYRPVSSTQDLVQFTEGVASLSATKKH